MGMLEAAIVARRGYFALGYDVQETPLEVSDEMFESKRSKSPELRYFLLSEDGSDRAFVSGWTAANGVGVVEDLFTDTAYRHRGFATALIDAAVRDVRERGAGPVLIGADPADTPKRMYAR